MSERCKGCNDEMHFACFPKKDAEYCLICECKMLKSQVKELEEAFLAEHQCAVDALSKLSDAEDKIKDLEARIGALEDHLRSLKDPFVYEYREYLEEGNR